MTFFDKPIKGATFVWIAIYFVLMLSFSCQHGCGCNGCTSTVIVDQEARKIRVDDIRMKVTANKNRVTNRKLKLDEELYIDKTIWYSIDYYLQVEKRPDIKNICEFIVPENQDIEMALDKFNVRFSPDKKHFAVGLDIKVYDFFHLLEEGVPFSSGCYYLKDSNFTFIQTANLDFNSINWNIFPKPENLLEKIIIPNNYSPWALNCNKQNVLKLLNQMPPGNSHEMVLINNWYCEIADIHFTQQRVDQILNVSPEWKKKALKSLLKEIDNSVSQDDSRLDESLDMILWIKDPLALNKADSMMFEDYFAGGYAGDYLVKRLIDNKSPLNKNIQSALLTTAKDKATNFQTKTDKMSENNAFEILLFFKEYSILKTFIENNVQLEAVKNDFTDISIVTIKKYNSYPKDLQTLMVKNYHEIAKRQDLGLSGFDISEVVEFLKDKIPCTDLKKLVELHKNDLVAFQFPKGC